MDLLAALEAELGLGDRQRAASQASASRPPDRERLAAGIKAALVIRIIAGATDRTYTPTEVSEMVSEIVDEQVARMENER